MLGELSPDGTAKELIDATATAFVLDIALEHAGQLRVLTDHDGPVPQRQSALQSLTTHIRATITRKR